MSRAVSLWMLVVVLRDVVPNSLAEGRGWLGARVVEDV